jgi:ABC-type uncharacterized transport system involved in gliding motility auxiliary subunit
MEGAETVELFETGPDGWAVSSLGRDSYDVPAEGVRPGPGPLAVAVEAEVAPRAADAEAPTAPERGEADEASAEPERDAMRLVVIGDSDFATTAFLQMGPGNQTLVNNVFNWLVDREELVGIPPKRPEQVRLSMTKAQSDWAMLLVLVGLPALAIAAGFWVWSRRRRVR